MRGFKISHHTTLDDANEFVQTCLDNGIEAARDLGRPAPQHYLNHATHSNTFILIFSTPELASWMVTYETEGDIE